MLESIGGGGVGVGNAIPPPKKFLLSEITILLVVNGRFLFIYFIFLNKDDLTGYGCMQPFWPLSGLRQSYQDSAGDFLHLSYQMLFAVLVFVSCSCMLNMN